MPLHRIMTSCENNVTVVNPCNMVYETVYYSRNSSHYCQVLLTHCRLSKAIKAANRLQSTYGQLQGWNHIHQVSYYTQLHPLEATPIPAGNSS